MHELLCSWGTGRRAPHWRSGGLELPHGSHWLLVVRCSVHVHLGPLWPVHWQLNSSGRPAGQRRSQDGAVVLAAVAPSCSLLLSVLAVPPLSFSLPRCPPFLSDTLMRALRLGTGWPQPPALRCSPLSRTAPPQARLSGIITIVMSATYMLLAGLVMWTLRWRIGRWFVGDERCPQMPQSLLPPASSRASPPCSPPGLQPGHG